ncbi:MAG: fimbrillin family protein [Prevotellaceae bacterium]|jgi:Leucine-rich repeat (LRR) protein|nr:fimbrillin family protein [Prevotellaceae bacterium]
MTKAYFTFTAIVALCTAIFTSCNKDDGPAPEPPGSIAVNLRADIKPEAATKAANNQWETNDEVGLYMKRAGQSLTATGAVYSDAANVRMSISDGRLASNPPVMYPAAGNVDFIAYYPYTASVDNGYTIAASVAGQAEGLPSEILYSNNISAQAATEDPVTLNFQYSLAKLELTVTGGANSSLTAADFAAMTVSIEGMHTEAKLQLADGTFTDRQNKQTITLYRTGGTDASAVFEALALPVTPADGELAFIFEAAGKTYRYETTGNYAAANLYKLHFGLDFPSFPERTAALLNAVIIPRAENSQSIPVDATQKMTMTTEAAELSFTIGGTGQMIIDWGDGSPDESYTLTGNRVLYTHGYSDAPPHAVTITGENITEFNCGRNWNTGVNNQLTSLDVSKNTALTELHCDNNQLSSLDLSKNTVLTELYCYGNQLSTLDLSKNTALTSLQCGYNQLSSLDVGKNTALTGLACNNNQLSTLDLSKNTALTGLACNYNQLSALDLSKNTELTYLICYINQLSSLDISKNTALTRLDCRGNQLSSLDISKNTALTYLLCNSNQLSALDLSKNTELTSLVCGENPLGTLDVSKNTVLTRLDCTGNQLSTLDLSKNTELTYLWCNGNQLTAAALDALFETLHGNIIESKSIHINDNPGTSACNPSIAEIKGWTVYTVY